MRLLMRYTAMPPAVAGGISLLARHRRALTSVSPEHTQIVGSV